MARHGFCVSCDPYLLGIQVVTRIASCSVFRPTNATCSTRSFGLTVPPPTVTLQTADVTADGNTTLRRATPPYSIFYLTHLLLLLSFSSNTENPMPQ